ncbi:Transposon Ty3-G Gag-Pol polyprotein [Armadillidium vulgare]|nr:Transposon Ty3-G Gag-Pol polyprotein [Armadillidium vulgare]
MISRYELITISKWVNRNQSTIFQRTYFSKLTHDIKIFLSYKCYYKYKVYNSQWSLNKSSVTYNTPKSSVTYNTPKSSVTYNTPQSSVNYNTPQSSVTYNTPKSSVNYNTPKSSIGRLVNAGVLSPSHSPWGFPISVLSKPSGGVPIVADLRLLYKRTVNDNFSLPNLGDFSNILAGAKVFSVLDLKKAFFNLKVHPDCRKFLTINTPYGSFSYNEVFQILSNTKK